MYVVMYNCTALLMLSDTGNARQSSSPVLTPSRQVTLPALSYPSPRASTSVASIQLSTIASLLPEVPVRNPDISNDGTNVLPLAIGVPIVFILCLLILITILLIAIARKRRKHSKLPCANTIGEGIQAIKL